MSAGGKGARARWLLIFSGMERAALFALQAAIGLVDLTIALFVAVHLGVIPPKKVEQFKSYAANAPLVRRFFRKETPAAPAPKKKPASAPKRAK